MAGFFDDVGEFFTGNDRNNAEQQAQDLAAQTSEQQAQIAQQQQQLAQGAQTQAAAADKGAAESMGTNAADYLNRSTAAALPGAAEEANTSSIGAARAALMAARTAGLNRGQAAIQAGQQATQGYGENLNRNLDQGRSRYDAATDRFANRGDVLANRGMGYNQQQQQARGMEYQAKNQGVQSKTAAANQSGQAGGNLLSGALNAAIGAFRKGTDFAPGGLAVVGEDGPELAQVPRGSKIVPAGPTKIILDQALLAKAKGQPLTIDQLLAKVRG